MDIYYKSRKLQEICTIKKNMVKKYGQDMAERLMQRLGELEASETLGDMR